MKITKILLRGIAVILQAALLMIYGVGFAAEAQNSPEASPSVIILSQPAPNVFHLVVRTSTDPSDMPTSPFVVAPGESVPPPDTRAAGSAELKGTPGDATTPITLVSSSGKILLKVQSTSFGNNQTSISFTHDPTDRFYGWGNDEGCKSGPLVQTSGIQRTMNTCTRVPFIWSPSGYGIFIANDPAPGNWISWGDGNGNLTWNIPGEFSDIYLMAAPDGYGVLGEYSRLTGSPPIPPRWTFGFLMSRWGYQDAADVQDKWHQFRDRKIPIDAFIYDYDWFANDWAFEPRTFPNPAANLAEMHAMNLHFVGIRKPRVNGPNLDYATAHGWIIKGMTDLRFDIATAREWWWSKQLPAFRAGVDGWWNDEAEATYDEFFNMSKLQYEGGRAATGKRQWSIDRAFAPGLQHYGAAVWTGDIDSNWQTLQQQPGTLLNWSMAGMPYVSQDTGGFQSLPSPELYTRWMEEAVFIPVMRAHGTFNSARWPWAFGDAAQAATVKAIELRYRLIPYLYTLADGARRTGAPLMRPLFMEFPEDQKTWTMQDEWLLGDRLLAAPVLATGGQRAVYLPAGGWFDGNTGKAVAGGQTVALNVPLDVIPFYVRAGTILPLGPIIQSTAEAEDPLEVRIYPGADATFSLYEDAGDDYNYEKGEFSIIPMHWDEHARVLTIGDRQGSYQGMLATRHLQLVLPDVPAKTVIYTGQKLSVQL